MNGQIPPNGSTVTLNYDRTTGSAGNVGVGEITELSTSVDAQVTNLAKTSGGSDIETLDQLKKRIPIANRTLDRAVTRQDYIDLASIASGVAKAGVSYEGGRVVTVYIIPESGGIASQTLLDSVQAFMDDRKIITTAVNVVSAGENRLQLDVFLNINGGYSSVSVTEEVRAQLEAFFSYEDQDVGSEVYISDVYQVIEGVEGVRNSVIERMSLSPYAYPVEGNKVLDWSHTLKETAKDTALYRITFLSPSVFQLLRNDKYVGEYETDQIVSTEDLDFRINGTSYDVNDSWEFYVYPYVSCGGR